MVGILGRCRPVNVTRSPGRAVPYASMSPRTMPTAPASSGLAIRVLGPLEVAVDGTPLVVDTRKALAILALVAVDQRPFARDELAAMLWPESDDESARGALRRTLSVLRSAVGDRGLRVDRATVALDPSASWVDLRVVEAATGAGDRATLAAAASLARGGFLAGFSLRDSAEFDEWRATRTTAVERTVGALLDRVADALEAEGDLEGAAGAARRRLELDPLDEAAHRRVMAILARAGDRAGAIRQYRSCVAALDRELGVAPLAETTDLYEQILDGRVGTAGTRAAPLAATVGRGTPAVTEVTPAHREPFRLPLVGRDAELVRARAVLEGAGSRGRVVAVTGEAGIGKSRVAESLADALAATGATVLVARSYPSEAGIAYG